MKYKMKRNLARGVLVAGLVTLLAVVAFAMGPPVYIAEPFSAQVVDAGTGKPIEGAIVVANWELVRGGFDGERHVGQLDVQETVTDATGMFSFAGFTRFNPRLAELRNADPRVLIFKSGYEVAVEYSTIREPFDYPKIRRKPTIDGNIVRLTTMPYQVAGAKFIRFHDNFQNSVNQLFGDCEWKRMPRLLQAMADEEKRLHAIYPQAHVAIGLENLSQQTPVGCEIKRETR